MPRPRPSRREQLINQRQQLSTQWGRKSAEVGLLLDKLVARQTEVITLRDKILLIDWELDKLVDEKIATAWQETLDDEEA